MEFVAYRSIKNNTDVLYIDFNIIQNDTQLTDLVRTWIEDRGCHDKLLLTRVRNTLKELYKDDATYGENTVNSCQVCMHKEYSNHRYEIVFNYKTFGELTYKKQEHTIK